MKRQIVAPAALRSSCEAVFAERRVVLAADELAREDAPRRERVVDARDDDLRVALVDAAETSHVSASCA